MRKTYDVIVAGYLCLDLAPCFNKKTVLPFSEYFIPGKLMEIEGMDFVLGGLVANTGLMLKRFGKNVFLNGLIGDDIMGEIVERMLKGYNAGEGIYTTNLSKTAFSIVVSPPGNDRLFWEFPGCNQIFNLNNINFLAVSKSKILHFGYPPLLRQFYLNDGEQLYKLFAEVRDLDVLSSLDFSLPDQESESARINWRTILTRTLPLVDIFTPSLEELFLMMKPEQYPEIERLLRNPQSLNKTHISLIREVGSEILKLGVNILLIKMGALGAYLLTNDVSLFRKQSFSVMNVNQWSNREIWCNAYPVDHSKIINASGAGDTAVAAFLSAILDRESPENAIKFAAIAGRNSLYCHNILDEMSCWEDLSLSIINEMKSDKKGEERFRTL